MILAVLWAAFFAWPYLQRRLSGSRRDSIGDFSKRVSAIGGRGMRRTRSAPIGMPRRSAPVLAGPVGSGRPLGAPAPGTGLPSSDDAIRRRRDALAVLGVAAVGSLLLALVTGSTLLWVVNGIADLLLVGFVVLLASIARQARERRAKVHYLPQPAPVQSSALVLRRTASS